MKGSVRPAASGERPLWPGIALVLGVLASGCGPQEATGTARTETDGGAEAAAPESAESGRTASREGLVDVAAAVGLDFRHDHGGTGERYMIESVTGGGGFVDLDGDGWLDVYLTQGTRLGDGLPPSEPLRDRIFRNRGDGTFEDATGRWGGAEPGYGSGFCAADVDRDGDLDIVLPRFGPDRLLLQEDGRLRDRTGPSGLGDPAWASSCALADADGDGCLDLYVVRYVDFSLDHHIECEEKGRRVYCHPDVYSGVHDLYYRGRCDGTFVEATAEAGLRIDDPREGKGLGVLWSDLDDDGDQDLYVSNDSTRNFLFLNDGSGSFREVGIETGLAYNVEGKTEAGMGVDAGDVDGDGRFDLFVAHLDDETNTLYRQLGEGLFADASMETGLASPSLGKVGFGVAFLDVEADGDLDLYVANGHIIDNVAELSPGLAWAQPDQLLLNDGTGRFRNATPAEAGEWFTEARVGRGLAVGDVDGDADPDLLVLGMGEPAALLENRWADGGRSVLVRAVDLHGSDAIGARLTLVAGGRSQVREVRAGSGFLSQGDLRVHFGLGDGEPERLEVRWPDGGVDVVDGGSLRIGAATIVKRREGDGPEVF